MLPQNASQNPAPPPAWRQPVLSTLSPLAFGGAPLGNLYTEVSDAAAAAAIQRAWEGGIRHFDTAPYYGFGLSENRLGAALVNVSRASFTLSTKVGRLIEADAGRQGQADGFAVDGLRARFDYSRDGVRRSVEASLRRLGTDHIDILFLHDIGALTHGEQHPQILAQALDEALPEMARLRDEGLVGAIGLGVNEEAVCLEVMPRFSLDTIMLAGRYTLFEQEASREVMARAEAEGVAILVAGPYNSGLLGDPDRPGDTYNYAPASAAVRERAGRLYDTCHRSGADVGAAALQFPLAHPAVASVVCGLRSVAEVESALARQKAAVPANAWAALRAEGIIAAGVPTP
ncbi:aldo/keto reductase [Luteibacter aegosomaticola]|uniref:aldo/keto reductase n=1 Tax=Luteibacter aegosomaticola TaxID=2911538 RepID=UPI001FFB73CA|nr:aldo/keto reductase [Luteibacter aegosomaticola]UPG91534.1 aldo/keto reductase [Luteibacter aegosomaticola]